MDVPRLALPLNLRSALRGLARDRAFTFFSVLALALGLGLNGSLLVLSRAFLLRPAPVSEPATLLEVTDNWKRNISKDARGSTTAYEAVRTLPEFEGTALSNGPATMSWNRPEGFPGLSAPILIQSCLLLAATAALACLVPALRAMRVRPSEALRSE